MSIHEACVLGLQLDVVLGKVAALVAPVDASNVIAYVGLQGLPVVLELFIGNAFSPAIVVAVLDDVAIASSGVHELLWNASHIDTGATNTPLGSNRSRLNIIKENSLSWTQQKTCLLGTCNTTRASTNHCKFIIVLEEPKE